MDRRPPRAVSDPIIRQVGFFTPAGAATPLPPAAAAAAAAPPIAAAAPSPEAAVPNSSISPVMIPPLRHAASAAAGGVDHSNPLHLPSPPASDSVLSSPPAPSSPLSSAAPFTVGSEFSGEDFVAPPLPPPTNTLARSKLPSVPETSRVDTAEPQVSNGELDNSAPSKPKTTKAERRALQEAQRAAKAAAKEAGTASKSKGASSAAVASNLKEVKSAKGAVQKKDPLQVPVLASSQKKVVDRAPEREKKKDIPHPRMQFDDASRVVKAKKRAVVNQSEARNRVELFRHLPQYVHGSQLPDLESKFFQLEPMHPSVYKIGLQYISGDISGGNARCVAMLLAFKDAIRDYSTPPEKTLIRELTAKIGSFVSFLIECRPLSVSMGNAIRFMKSRIAKLPHNLSESEAKASLQSDIDRFINEKIIVADKVIVDHAVTKIKDGDVLLTYGSSSVVEMILIRAHELGKQFRVVVLDSRPKLEGQALLRKLVARGLYCTYTHINAISYIMHEVTKVFLGASSILSNGTVYSRVGTACVAMVAREFRLPVLVCCEAYKFHERVQLDSICCNELGDPDVISKVPGREDVNYLADWEENENLQLLNLMYDATPADYISMIITDYGMLPPTSVPVIVREYRREQLWI